MANEIKESFSFGIFVGLLSGVILVLLVGAFFLSGTNIQHNQNNCILEKDYNSIINNETIIAQYIQSETQCLKTIQKCQITEDNNISFAMRCLK